LHNKAIQTLSSLLIPWTLILTSIYCGKRSQVSFFLRKKRTLLSLTVSFSTQNGPRSIDLMAPQLETVGFFYKKNSDETMISLPAVATIPSCSLSFILSSCFLFLSYMQLINFSFHRCETLDTYNHTCKNCYRISESLHKKWGAVKSIFRLDH